MIFIMWHRGFFPQNKRAFPSGQDIWVIGKVWGQGGWILAKFFFCVFLDRDEVEVHKLAKKERGQYPAILTEQNWSIKDLLYGFRGNFSCTVGSPEWERWLHLARSGSQSHRAIWIILPARGACHKMNMSYWPSMRSRWLDIDQELFWVFMDRDRVKVHKHANAHRIWICSLLDKTSLVNKLKRFTIWKKKLFSC